MFVTRHTTYTSMDEVKKAVLAAELNVGSGIYVLFDGKTTLFDVIGIDVDDTDETGYQHSVTVQTHDILEKRLFDGTPGIYDEPGSNVWGTSALRRYLNSDEFKARVPAIAPYLGTAKKINSNGGTTEDTFFILSKDEYDPDVTPYRYYYNRRNRVKFTEGGHTDYHWTRSAYDKSYYVWYMACTGYIYGNPTRNKVGYAPACVLIF